MKKLLTVLFTIGMLYTAQADCVWDGKSATSYKLLNSNTVMFTDAYGGGFIVKTYSYLTSYPDNVYVIKDSFCSYENDVFVWDGEVIDVTEVTKIN